jgi:hypothetical protein
MQDRTGNKARTSFVAPYAGNYLYGTYENGHQAGGRIAYVKLFGLIGLFIIFIAAVNFMNLATARASVRMKEVGVRKTLGASRWALVKQFLGESLLLSIVALLLAIVIVWLLLEPFNAITGKQLRLHFSWQLAALFAGITLFTGLLAGSYPAFFLSAFRPAGVLKGKMVNSAGSLLARKGLVVFQFGVSVVLIVAVMVVERQMSYIRNRNLGYQKDHVVYFNAEGKVPEHGRIPVRGPGNTRRGICLQHGGECFRGSKPADQLGKAGPYREHFVQAIFDGRRDVGDTGDPAERRDRFFGQLCGGYEQDHLQ